jgi:hypothetical protein
MRNWLLGTVGVLGLGLVVAAGQSVVVNSKDASKTPQEKIASSRIVKVTVYPNSALVTREVNIPAGQGVSEIVVSPMPIRIIDSSLYSENANGIRVLSTRFRTRQVFEDTREDVRKLEDELKKLQLLSQRLVAESRSVEQNMQMLGKLENFTTVTTVTSTEKGGLNGDNVITLAKYVMDQRSEKVRELVDLQQKLETLKEQSDFARRKLQELTAGTSKMERDAVLVVERANGAGGTVRLNYLVDSAGWQPQYKLRAGTAKEPVQLDYLASLVQHSGEDWNSVDLTLSTAQPQLNAAPPTLAKLEMSVIARASVPMPMTTASGGVATFTLEGKEKRADLEQQARTLRVQAESLSQSIQVAPSPAQASGTGQAPPSPQSVNPSANQSVQVQRQEEAVRSHLNAAAALEYSLELVKSRDEILAANRKRSPSSSNEGPSVTYHLASKITVPSRNDEQIVEVAKLTFNPKYYYKAVPVLNRHVYRLADLTNNSKQTLLPGEATIYQGNDFVGRMSMPLVAIGEEFTAGLGVDPQLQIQREMVDKTRDMQGGNQILTFKYRILVSSFKDEKINLQVWDRLPFAEKEIAGIDILKSEPELSKDALYQRESRPNNLLRWDLAVNPNLNGENAVPISYEFRLQLDRNMVIGNFLVR